MRQLSCLMRDRGRGMGSFAGDILAGRHVGKGGTCCLFLAAPLRR